MHCAIGLGFRYFIPKAVVPCVLELSQASSWWRWCLDYFFMTDVIGRYKKMPCFYLMVIFPMIILEELYWKNFLYNYRKKCLIKYVSSFVFKDFVYLFLDRKGERKRGRKTLICGCLSRTPYWGPGLQPRHVPWLGIELETLWFAG